METNEQDRQWLEGSEEDFNRLYQRYNRDLRFLLFQAGFVQNVNIDDIFQEIWLRVFVRKDRCPEDVDVFVWLQQVAKSTALDYHNVNRPDPFSPRDISGIAANISEDFRTRRRISMPLHRLLEEENIRFVRELVSMLPVRQCDVIRSRWFEGLSCAETTRNLGGTARSIQCCCARALENLKRIFEEMGHETI